MKREALAVFVGGVAGTLLRVGLAEVFPVSAGAWPWATLTANLLGAFLAGWLVTRLPGGRHTGRHPLLVTGFCGGLTTFATLQLELLELIDTGHGAVALTYAAVSLIAGLALFTAAVRIAGSRRGRGAA